MKLVCLLPVLAAVVLLAGAGAANPQASGNGTYTYPALGDLPAPPPTSPLQVAWAATHVVVVAARPGGGVEVVESWHGDLKPGDALDLPELYCRAPLNEFVHVSPNAGVWSYLSEQVRAGSAGLWGMAGSKRPAHFLYRDASRYPGQPWDRIAARSVLFLTLRVSPSAGGMPNSVVYFPSAGSIEDCLVEIIRGEVRGYGRLAGASGWMSWTKSREDAEMHLRERVGEAIRARATFTSAISAEDAGLITAEAVRLLRTDSDELRAFLLAELAKAGPAALPALRATLADNTLWPAHAGAVKALARVGGAAVESDLARLLAEDVAYWKATAPKLPTPQPGSMTYSYPALSGPEAKPACRLDRTEAILGALKPDAPPDCRKAVAELKALWMSQPQLARWGDAAHCAALLGVPPEPPAPAPVAQIVPAQVSPPVGCAYVPVVVCPPPVVIYYAAPCPPPVVAPVPCVPRRR